jgi:hypothetical protein
MFRSVYDEGLITRLQEGPCGLLAVHEMIQEVGVRKDAHSC